MYNSKAHEIDPQELPSCLADFLSSHPTVEMLKQYWRSHTGLLYSRASTKRKCISLAKLRVFSHTPVLHWGNRACRLLRPELILASGKIKSVAGLDVFAHYR